MYPTQHSFSVDSVSHAAKLCIIIDQEFWQSMPELNVIDWSRTGYGDEPGPKSHFLPGHSMTYNFSWVMQT